MNEIKNCPLCNAEKISFGPVLGDYRDITCERCGRFLITGSLGAAIVYRRDKLYIERLNILSGIARNRFESNPDDPIKFTTSNIEQLVNASGIPQTVPEKIDHLLLFFNRKTTFGGEAIRLNSENDYPIAFCKNQTEFVYLLRYLIEVGYVKEEGWSMELTFSGFKKAEELLGKRPKGDQCFVAMSFADELNDAYDKGIFKAVDAAKYKVIRVDREEHNDKIDDKIISDIRRSSLLIADVTMHRQGVYFEAGFAMGLGIPVIWTCRETDIKQAHFDTRQYNHIVWTASEELYDKLLNRINALYPLGQ
ncbi:MAG: hypothetical protein ABSG42_07020 [Nitrospirota bacterium]